MKNCMPEIQPFPTTCLYVMETGFEKEQGLDRKERCQCPTSRVDLLRWLLGSSGDPPRGEQGQPAKRPYLMQTYLMFLCCRVKKLSVAATRVLPAGRAWEIANGKEGLSGSSSP